MEYGQHTLVGDHEVWVSVPAGSGWLTSYRVVEQDGELVIAEVRINPEPHNDRDLQWLKSRLTGRDTTGGAGRQWQPPIPSMGLSARQARRAIRTGDVIAEARKWALFSEGILDRSPRLARIASADRISKQTLNAPRRVGRKGRSDHYYAEIADAYVAAVERGSRSPVADVAKRLSDTPSHIRDVLYRARQRELLTHPSPGVAGGRLTPKAIALLND